jgi:hemerythrin superfamily protein
MDAIVMLKDDHKAVEKVFKEFEKTKDSATPAKKRQLVDEIIHALTVHAYIEEEIFYPAAWRADESTKEHVLESVEEHHVVVWMLSELMELEPTEETFDAKVTVLMENVRHHVEEEEKEWFPDVRKSLGRKALTELGERMQAARSKAPKDPLAMRSARDQVKK